MAGTITKDGLFQSARPAPQSRADLTNRAARAILSAEADSREAKIQRQRQARLEMEAQRPAPAKRPALRKARAFAARRSA